MIRYMDACAIWANFPESEVWLNFWGSMSLICTCVSPEELWRQCFQVNLVRLLQPEQRLSAVLNRISAEYRPITKSGLLTMLRWDV